MIVKLDDSALILPEKAYGPICQKIFKEFCEHHGLPENMPVPEPSLKMHLSLSRIIDMMAHSMGEEKRAKILQEVEEYKANLDEIENSYVADVKFTHVNRARLGSPVSMDYLTRDSQPVEQAKDVVVP